MCRHAARLRGAITGRNKSDVLDADVLARSAARGWATSWDDRLGNDPFRLGHSGQASLGGLYRKWPQHRVQLGAEGWAPVVHRLPVPAPRAASGLAAVLRRAHIAQAAFAAWPESRADALLAEVADRVADAARVIAQRTVAETGVGCVEDKAHKNRFAARSVFASVVGQPGCGPLGAEDERGVVEVARPVGVVVALMPLTNPMATFVYTVLIALQARNALVVRAHRRAADVTEDAARFGPAESWCGMGHRLTWCRPCVPSIESRRRGCCSAREST